METSVKREIVFPTLPSGAAQGFTTTAAAATTRFTKVTTPSNNDLASL